jgi:hypothetical protein
LDDSETVPNCVTDRCDDLETPEMHFRNTEVSERHVVEVVPLRSNRLDRQEYPTTAKFKPLAPTQTEPDVGIVTEEEFWYIEIFAVTRNAWNSML